MRKFVLRKLFVSICVFVLLWIFYWSLHAVQFSYLLHEGYHFLRLDDETYRPGNKRSITRTPHKTSTDATAPSHNKNTVSKIISKGLNVNVVGDNQHSQKHLECRITQTSNKKFAFLKCSDMEQIQIIQELGHGVSKQGFLGKFRGIPVVVKVADLKPDEVNKGYRECMKNMWNVCAKDGFPIDIHYLGRDSEGCIYWKILDLVREVLFLHHLDHPGFMKLLGYCFGDGIKVGNITGLGAVSVFEKGVSVFGPESPYMRFSKIPLQSRLKYAIDLSDFLLYLQNSPLGSVRLKDLCVGNSMLSNDTVKHSDTDDVVILEKECKTFNENGSFIKDGKQKNNTLDENKDKTNILCPYGLPCRAGFCVGYNAKHNMNEMHRVFWLYLLRPSSFPTKISAELVYVQRALEKVELSAEDLKLKLLSLQRDFEMPVQRQVNNTD